jgi:hypothetical protein
MTAEGQPPWLAAALGCARAPSPAPLEVTRIHFEAVRGSVTGFSLEWDWS